jgi:hypothetical protein
MLGLLVFAFETALGQPGGGRGGQAAQPPDPDYDWSAVLVSVDQNARTAVVRARVASHAKIEGLERFSPGQRLTLVWSGKNWAGDVFDLAANPQLEEGALTLPVEFVAQSSNDSGQYVDVRISVPADAVAKLASFTPGHRITGVSPRMATTDRAASVMSIRGYNEPAS